METNSLIILFVYFIALIFFIRSKIRDITTFSFILFGSLASSVTMLRSGLVESFGMGFWGPNGHDAIWHIAVINQIRSGLPIKNPVFSGEFLKNYHVGYDLLVAMLNTLTQLPVMDLYFRFLPLTFSLLLGYLTYSLCQNLNANKIQTRLAVILIYFSSSFGWIYHFLKYRNLEGESLFWSMQAISTQINPPFALSLCLLALGLLLYIKNKSPYFIGLVFGIMTITKIYSGLLVLAAFGLEFLYKKQDRKKILKIVLTQILVSFLIIRTFIYTLGSTVPFIFKPFWFSHSLIESTDKLYLPKIATLIQNLSANPFSVKLPLLIFLEVSTLTIFLIGNLGIRILAFTKAPEKNSRLLYNISLIGLLIPIFFIQSGTAWNTIQFMYYSLYFASILSVRVIFNYQKLALFIIISIGIIGSIGTIKDYFGFPPPAYLPQHTQAALAYLENLPGGIVLTYPFDKYLKTGKATPLHLFEYETTAYVSALTGKSTYLEDEVNLDITGYNWQLRRENSKKFFNSSNIFEARGFLLNNQVEYIYLEGGQKLPFPESELQVDDIYNNGHERIYKVQK